METTSKTTVSGAPPAVEANLARLQREGLGQMAWLGAAMFETLTALGAEVVQFVSERVAEDVKTQQALLHCRDIKEAQRLQVEFVQTALQQYTAETGRLVQIGSGVMNSVAPKRKKDSGPV